MLAATAHASRARIRAWGRPPGPPDAGPADADIATTSATAGVNSSTCGRITNARPNSRPELIDPARHDQQRPLPVPLGHHCVIKAHVVMQKCDEADQPRQAATETAA